MTNSQVGQFRQLHDIHSPHGFLIERTFFCFKILEALHHSHVAYSLRGGLSMPVLLSRFARLSQDIDIVLYDEIERLEKMLDEMVISGIINEWWTDESRVFEHRCHYVIDYISTISGVAAILNLDVITGLPRHDTIDHEYRMRELTQPFTISIQCAEEIMADKLIACAVNTIGLKLENNFKFNSLVKQNFDIRLLMEFGLDITVVYNSFCEKVQTGNLFNDSSYRSEMILNDVKRYLQSFYQDGNLSEAKLTEYRIHTGINSLNVEICDEPYDLDGFLTTNRMLETMVNELLLMS